MIILWSKKYSQVKKRVWAWPKSKASESYPCRWWLGVRVRRSDFQPVTSAAFATLPFRLMQERVCELTKQLPFQITPDRKLSVAQCWGQVQVRRLVQVRCTFELNQVQEWLPWIQCNDTKCLAAARKKPNGCQYRNESVQESKSSLFQLGKVALQMQNKIKLWTESGHTGESKHSVVTSYIDLTQVVTSRAVASEPLSGFLGHSLTAHPRSTTLKARRQRIWKATCFRKKHAVGTK